MLCIFKTPLVPHPDIPGKLKALRDAGECQAACHAQVAECEHSPTVQHRKEGRYLRVIQKTKHFRGKPVTTQQQAALDRNPDLLLFDEIEEHDELVSEGLDLTPREVMISPSCVKDDGTPVTLADFPDNWSFGNGVTVAVTVPIVGSEPCVLSWCVFPPRKAAEVRAKYETLRQVMEN